MKNYFNLTTKVLTKTWVDLSGDANVIILTDSEADGIISGLLTVNNLGQVVKNTSLPFWRK